MSDDIDICQSRAAIECHNTQRTKSNMSAAHLRHSQQLKSLRNGRTCDGTEYGTAEKKESVEDMFVAMAKEEIAQKNGYFSWGNGSYQDDVRNESGTERNIEAERC